MQTVMLAWKLYGGNISRSMPVRSSLHCSLSVAEKCRSLCWSNNEPWSGTPQSDGVLEQAKPAAPPLAVHLARVV